MNLKLLSPTTKLMPMLLANTSGPQRNGRFFEPENQTKIQAEFSSLAVELTPSLQQGIVKTARR